MVEYAAGHPPRADWDMLRALQLAAVAVGSALIVAGLFPLRQHQHIAAPTVGSKSEPRAYAYPKPHEPHAATKRPARAKPKPPSVRAERSPPERARGHGLPRERRPAERHRWRRPRRRFGTHADRRLDRRRLPGPARPSTR